MRLDPGDIILLYTDGLVEGKNLKGEDFGEDKLAACAGKNAHQTAKVFLNGLVEALKQFVNGPIEDDITVVVLKIE